MFSALECMDAVLDRSACNPNHVNIAGSPATIKTQEGASFRSWTMRLYLILVELLQLDCVTAIQCLTGSLGGNRWG
jgi:hypothetical protein